VRIANTVGEAEWTNDECKRMALRRVDVVRSKTVVNNKIAGQINMYNCLGRTPILWRRKWAEKEL